MKHFWEQLAFIANALIFLMVGLTLVPSQMWQAMDILAIVIGAMLIARLAVVFGLIPMVGKLPGSRPVDKAYKIIMWWGGLRGAIALALVLSLPHFPHADTLVILVMGAVLFTLLVQGLSMEPVVKKLGLTRPTLNDQLAMLERDLMADRQALQRIQQLQTMGLFSRPIAYHLQRSCEQAAHVGQEKLATLRQSEMNKSRETALLYQRALTEERLFYNKLYNQGHLSEHAYRELVLVLTLQIDAIRHHGTMEHVHSHRLRRLMEKGLYHLLDPFPLLAPLAERLRMQRIISNYEQVWGHYLGSKRVLQYLKELKEMESIPDDIFDHVHEQYQHWHHFARKQLNHVSEQFPEFVTSMQQRLGQRLVLLADIKATEDMRARGMLPEGVAEHHVNQINAKLEALRGQSINRLKLAPEQLLRKVKLFKNLDQEHFRTIVEHLQPLTLADGDTVIRQGDTGTSLYLIARGVVRIIREEDGREEELGTLMAGDCFGEVALLQQQPRNATVKCVTPCMLYKLTHADMQELMKQNPDIRQQLEQASEHRG
jgi:CPA1 family monovalent cation:H+ antiporter